MHLNGCWYTPYLLHHSLFSSTFQSFLRLRYFFQISLIFMTTRKTIGNSYNLNYITNHFKFRSATAMRLGWFTMYPSTVWHQTTFGGIHWVFCSTQLWRLQLFRYLHSCFSTTRYTSKLLVYKVCNNLDKTVIN